MFNSNKTRPRGATPLSPSQSIERHGGFSALFDRLTGRIVTLESINCTLNDRVTTLEQVVQPESKPKQSALSTTSPATTRGMSESNGTAIAKPHDSIHHTAMHVSRPGEPRGVFNDELPNDSSSSRSRPASPSPTTQPSDSFTAISAELNAMA